MFVSEFSWIQIEIFACDNNIVDTLPIKENNAILDLVRKNN